jgi:2-amino-4-hydroxy-6-hydroxymethyldihydropteridine diphosphokinase
VTGRSDEGTMRGAAIEKAAIALGSNLGQSEQILKSALNLLHASPGVTVLHQSSLYQTTPVGPPQPDYVNACAVVETRLDPEDLLARLLQIEQQFGRVRQERWGARTLDLDLLLFGDRILKTADLEIPHPRMGDRAFVLIPLAEIAPDWIHPLSQRAIAHLACQVDGGGVHLLRQAKF